MNNQKGVVHLLLLVVVFVAVFGIGYYAYQSGQLRRATPAEVQETNTTYTNIDTSNWKTYKNDLYKYEFKYPEEMSIVSSDNFGIELSTPAIACKTAVTGATQYVYVSDLMINTHLYSGVEFENVWREIYGFQLEGNYDGQTKIGGKPSYYYYQGAENLYSRKTILVKIDTKDALEINIHTPTFVYECTDIIKPQTELNNLSDQILSTFKFIEN